MTIKVWSRMDYCCFIYNCSLRAEYCLLNLSPAFSQAINVAAMVFALCAAASFFWNCHVGAI